MSNNKKTLLRPEARPYNWESLNHSQQKAFERIVALMINAVQDIDQRDSQSKLTQIRSNQTILLTGDRGMGKTSLMLSLMAAVTERAEFQASHEDGVQIKKKIDDNLRGRIVWLETLDMESLPGPTNLLVSILARIENAMGKVSHDSGTPQGFLNPNVASEKAQMEFRRLKSEASLAWDGNIRERSAKLDPDIYAHEVMKAEQARLGLNVRLNSVVDDLALRLNWSGSAASPMFVLPVDDFDLNPVRCLELLRLIRAISMLR